MEQSFDRPIPGMGMTFEVGSRPWQTPPEITTVEQATNYYVERMNTDQFKAQLVDVIEMGVPLATLANTIQLASVMEGVHSVDVGMLVIPIIVELLMTIAEAEGVQYQTGMEGMETERPTAVSRIINDKMNELRAPTEDIGIEEPQVELQQEEQPQPMGLMARRV
jgi:hypothetical protein|tara:strand:- start:19 stop:513 length:495 start_codon:yes stop_codon:yes gene_type:complete